MLITMPPLPYCGIFSVPAENVAAPLVPVVVSEKGAENAPVPFRNVVAAPDEVPKRAAGMVPVFAEPRALTM